MKYIPLIWWGIWRNPWRSILTFLQVTVAFVLFGELQGIKSGFDDALASARADMLFVTSRVSLAEPLPLAYLDRIRSVPNVVSVSIQNFLIATYQRPNQVVAVIASNPDESWLKATPKFIVAPEQFAQLAKMRTAALVSVGLARKFGWKVGDRIPLSSSTLNSSGSGTWMFDIVGTFTFDDVLSARDFVLINNSYFDGARLTDKGTVRLYSVIVSDPKLANSVAENIDRLFANSAHETSTQSVRELAQSQIQSIGNVNFVIRAIMSAVFVALLLSTTAMMMQSIRERTPELAVLKACGFSHRKVFGLVLVEAVMVCVGAAMFGLLVATCTLLAAAKLVTGLSMPASVVAVGLCLAVFVAFITAYPPALRASRLQIVDALAGR